MLGDKVIVKGERLGCVAYIGKLDFDIFDQIYIGACLDMPGKGPRAALVSKHANVMLQWAIVMVC